MSELTLTVKYGGKRDEAPWIVLRGENAAELRATALDYFGQDPNAYEGLSMHEVVLKLSAVARGTQVFADVLGAEVIPTNGTGAAPGGTETTSARGSAAFDAAAGTPAEPADPYASVIAQMEAAESIPALKKTYATYKDAYEASEAVRDAYKARYKALK